MTPVATKSMITPEELLERYYYKGLNKFDEQVLREVVDEQVKFQGVFGHKSKRGIQYLLDYKNAMRKALGPCKFEMEDIIVSKDDTKASVRVSCRGIHKQELFGAKGSQHEIHFKAAAFFRFGNGNNDGPLKITEIHVVGNLDDLKRQIGADANATKAFPSFDVSESFSFE